MCDCDMDWQPFKTAPANTRVLVHDDRGHVQIARSVALRWYDDADRLIDPPVRWMALPVLDERGSKDEFHLDDHPRFSGRKNSKVRSR